jgi:bifunctional DNA-binding transcriptional regulator/antitoxin component of YhaV-PrlF toxin-antitoxin module
MDLQRTNCSELVNAKWGVRTPQRDRVAGFGCQGRLSLSDCTIVGMARTTLRAKGQLTLSDAIGKAAHLEEGDMLEAEVTADGILLRPEKRTDAAQAWFWTPEWQEGEREADADRAAQRGESFGSGEQFIDALRSRAKPGTP